MELKVLRWFLRLQDLRQPTLTYASLRQSVRTYVAYASTYASAYASPNFLLNLRQGHIPFAFFQRILLTTVFPSHFRLTF